MNALLGMAGRVAQVGTWFGGGLLVIASVVIGVEVIIRKLFNLSISGADELSGYAMAIGSAWAFSFALLRRAHIRIDSLYILLPLPVRALLDVVGLIAFGGFMALVTWFGWGVVGQSVVSGTRSMSALSVPVVIPQALWMAGLIFFVLVVLLLLVRALGLLFAGDYTGVQRLIGSRSATEEVENELEDLKARAAGPAAP